MSDDHPTVLRVVSGAPTDEEVAAVTAVLAARASAGGPGDSAPAGRSEWSRGAGLRRSLPAPGPGAWRAAARSR